jgi:hypothetical protein
MWAEHYAGSLEGLDTCWLSTLTSCPTGSLATLKVMLLMAGGSGLQLLLAKPGLLHQIALQAQFQSLVAMDRNDNALITLRLEVVAATNPDKLPAAPLQHSRELSSADRLQTAISSTCPLSCAASTSAEVSSLR